MNPSTESQAGNELQTAVTPDLEVTLEDQDKLAAAYYAELNALPELVEVPEPPPEIKDSGLRHQVRTRRAEKSREQAAQRLAARTAKENQAANEALAAWDARQKKRAPGTKPEEPPLFIPNLELSRQVRESYRQELEAWKNVPDDQKAQPAATRISGTPAEQEKAAAAEPKLTKPELTITELNACVADGGYMLDLCKEFFYNRYQEGEYWIVLSKWEPPDDDAPSDAAQEMKISLKTGALWIDGEMQRRSGPDIIWAICHDNAEPIFYKNCWLPLDDLMKAKRGLQAWWEEKEQERQRRPQPAVEVYDEAYAEELRAMVVTSVFPKALSPQKLIGTQILEKVHDLYGRNNCRKYPEFTSRKKIVTLLRTWVEESESKYFTITSTFDSHAKKDIFTLVLNEGAFKEAETETKLEKIAEVPPTEVPPLLVRLRAERSKRAELSVKETGVDSN
jgi:hypothetical protein